MAYSSIVRQFVVYLLIDLAAICFANQPATLAVRPASDELPRPHIFFFLSDDQSALDNGCYGNPVVKTPNIDRLAKQGMRFERFFTPGPICGPSRTAICTGQIPSSVGCWRNHGVTDEGTKSMVHYLRALGYRVVITGKNDCHPKSVYPFEQMNAKGKKKTKLGDFLRSHVKRHPDQPLCFLFNSRRPHTAYPENMGYDPKEMIIPPDMVDTPATREMLTRYYTEITEMDGEVGDCMADVEAAGLTKNTVFIYASDHGASLPHAKWNLYDAGIQMPFVVRWPGHVKPGSVTSSMASAIDILPTFIDIAGGEPIEKLHGESFLPTLLDAKKPHRDKIFATHTGNPLHAGGYNDYAIRAVRTEKFKYVLNLTPEKRWYSHCTDSDQRDTAVVYRTWVEKAKTDNAAADLIQNLHHRPAEELYDLTADPFELTNLAADPKYQETLAALREDVVTWRESLGDEGETKIALLKHLNSQRKNKNGIKPEYRKYLEGEN